MLNTAATLKTFFSQFDIPAYTLDSVPEDVELPYITYPLLEPEWGEQAAFYCQVWYRKQNLGALLAKADQVLAAIGAGTVIPMSGGYLAIYPSTPQMQTMTDDYSQSVYIALALNAYQMPGN